MFRQTERTKVGVFSSLLIPSSSYFSWRDVSCCMQQLVRLCYCLLFTSSASSAAVILVCCSNTVLLLCRLAILENCAQAATSWERKWMMMISSLTRALSYNSEHGWHCSHHQLRPTLYAMSYRADLILDILNLHSDSFLHALCINGSYLQLYTYVQAVPINVLKLLWQLPSRFQSGKLCGLL